jgi:hypothetical protein
MGRAEAQKHIPPGQKPHYTHRNNHLIVSSSVGI